MKNSLYISSLLLSLTIPMTSHAFDQSSPADSLVVDATGQIGVGTASPGSQLEVNDNQRIEIRMNNTSAENWRITSRGTGLEYGVVASVDPLVAIGKKLTLKKNGDLDVIGTLSVGGVNLTVPDYVFESDYELMPLKDLQTFIKKEKHLPKIASAKEINSSGKLNMTEMQMKLLEKVEELTLYLLDQESRISEQEIKIDGQQKSIVRLKSQLNK